MADQILTLKQVEDIFQEITTKMLGYDPTNPAHGNKVRIAYPTFGSPAWKITDDVAFISVNTEMDPITQQRDVQYSEQDIDNANRITKYTRVQTIRWTFYGPNSYDNAEKVRSLLFATNYRELLAASNLYLIMNVTVPVRAPEPFNNQYWERTDFVANFNEAVVLNGTTPYLKSANIRYYIKKGEINA